MRQKFVVYIAFYLIVSSFLWAMYHFMVGLTALFDVGMDADLYDEFGNYIGPELESDEEEEEGYGDREPEAQEYDVSYLIQQWWSKYCSVGQ
jgi:hypothetical protein